MKNDYINFSICIIGGTFEERQTQFKIIYKLFERKEFNSEIKKDEDVFETSFTYENFLVDFLIDTRDNILNKYLSEVQNDNEEIKKSKVDQYLTDTFKKPLNYGIIIYDSTLENDFQYVVKHFKKKHILISKNTTNDNQKMIHRLGNNFLFFDLTTFIFLTCELKSYYETIKEESTNNKEEQEKKENIIDSNEGNNNKEEDKEENEEIDQKDDDKKQNELEDEKKEENEEEEILDITNKNPFNIVIAGGNLEERKLTFKKIYLLLVKKNYSKEIKSTQSNIFEIKIKYNNDIYIQIQFDLREKIFPKNKLTNENQVEVIYKYLTESFGNLIHYGIILYKDEIKNYILTLANYFRDNYIFISNNCDESSTIYQKLKNQYKSFNNCAYILLLDELLSTESPTHPFNLYPLFYKYSKEKYYSNYLLYQKQFKIYSNKSLSFLLKDFNKYEKYSFDSDDYNDDSLIILQILTTQKVSNLKINLKKCICEGCPNTSSIVEYYEEEKKYYCSDCIERLTHKNNCNKCQEKLGKGNKFVCLNCQFSYCLKCIIKKIKENRKNPQCFCGHSFSRDEILDIQLSSSFC